MNKKQGNNPETEGQKPEKSVIDIVVDDKETGAVAEEINIKLEEPEKPEPPKVDIPKPAPVDPVDPVDKYRKEIVALNDKYTRLYAEYENYKKRAIKERDELLKYRAEPIATEILQIMDNLESALSHVTPNTDETLTKGVEMTTRELKKILDKFGLSEIDAKGKPFDPNFHHAMSMVERADLDNNTVIDIFRKGYTFKDRLIRAVTVSVSKKPAIVENNSADTNNTIQEGDLSS